MSPLTHPMPPPRRPRRTTTSPGAARRPLAALLALALALGGGLTAATVAIGPAAPAAAAPGNPGTPSPGLELYREDFENGSGLTNLPNYVGDGGERYTASDYWLNTSFCNGFVLSYQQTWPGTQYCVSRTNFDDVRAKTYALGLLNSPANPDTNRALSTNTSDAGTPARNQIMFATQQNLTLPTATGRFLTFSVDAAATACFFDTSTPDNQPRLRFYFRDANGTERPISSSAINPCTDSRSQMTFVSPPGEAARDVYYGEYPANGSILFPGGSVGIVLRNESNGNRRGNDGAIDNIRVLDVTPQLDKQFVPERAPRGGTSTLTFTVTNTDDLAAKNGWSFTDTLPAGLTIANPANAGGTCGGTRTAAAGGTTFSIADGQLAAGAASCTVTVDVTSSTTGSYTNGPDNVTQTGLNPPGQTTVVFTDPSYTVEKTASAATATPGSPITYTVQVRNTGEWAYDDSAPEGQRRASFTDDLSDVLDDATYNNDASQGATVSGNTLSWSGTLAVGETRTITYSVTPNRPPGAGNEQLRNAVAPTGTGGTCVPDRCSTTTPVQALAIRKTADRTTVVPGQRVTYTVTLSNTGAVAYTDASPASFRDDLSRVLDDADWNGDASASAGTVTYAQPTLSWSGPIAVGATVTVRYSVTVKDPDTGDRQLVNTVSSTSPGSNCAEGSTDAACSVSLPSAAYTVSKTSSTTVANPGDTVTYTVTVTNTGRVAYTATNPAGFTDDLSGVTDDAVYNNDATNGATVDGDTLSWSGPLAVGASTTITYSFTVRDPDPGDKRMTNRVAPNGPDGRCESASDCTTTTSVRSYTVAKTSSTATAAPGEVVTYTVTVTNTGAGDYTAEVPASFTDDLSAVLDDATYNGDATNGATVDGDTLSWSGPLAAGQSVQVRYSVTVNAPDTGDKRLTNAVAPSGPGGQCTSGDACTTTTSVSTFTVSKTASAESTTPGSTLTYTVTVRNTGTAAYTTAAPASFTDDLSRVLDDAAYNGDAAATSSDGGDAGEVSFASPRLSWTGPLAVGATVTVTYSVTATSPPSGDGRLVNAVSTSTPGCEGDCAPSTDTPVQAISFTKTADTDEVVPGQRVNYTITVRNTGQVAYTADSPASFDDDLSRVLDDAAYGDDAAATAGTVSYRQPRLSWSGPVGIGETVTITYSVTVNAPDTGDRVLDNAVVSSTPGSSCPPGEADPACRSVLPGGAYSVTKEASTDSAAQGATITYTVTVTNTGRTAYTDANPATFRDDLVGVLDDAAYNGDARATSGRLSYDRPNLDWSGALPVGGVVTVTYSVTVNSPATGDRVVRNSVVATGPGGECPACVTTATVPPGFAVHTGGAASREPALPLGWLALSGAGVLAGALVLRRRFTGEVR